MTKEELGVRQKKAETRRKIVGGSRKSCRLTMTGVMELQPDDGPRSCLSFGPGFGRCNGISREFARRFAEAIEKLAGSTPRDYRKETG
ncbi:hypothetical protein GW17_00052743 [Ensete ventricosum]|nr:hypothetical protein GW17_00052743 [Ensete ventricosum]